MSNYTVKLEGVENVIANLNRIDERVRGQAAFDAVEAGAYMIANKAKINAPVDTGALRNSAGVNVYLRGHGAEAFIGFRGLAYARIQEFGGLAGRNHTVKIQGKHYLGDAIDTEKERVVKAMSDAVAEYLR